MTEQAKKKTKRHGTKSQARKRGGIAKVPCFAQLGLFDSASDTAVDLPA